jgi:hypothetical protein
LAPASTTLRLPTSSSKLQATPSVTFAPLHVGALRELVIVSTCGRTLFAQLHTTLPTADNGAGKHPACALDQLPLLVIPLPSWQLHLRGGCRRRSCVPVSRAKGSTLSCKAGSSWQGTWGLPLMQKHPNQYAIHLERHSVVHGHNKQHDSDLLV